MCCSDIVGGFTMKIWRGALFFYYVWIILKNMRHRRKSRLGR